MKDDRDQVTRRLQGTHGTLDRFPDMQTLRDQLTEVEINTVSMDVAQKNRYIRQLGELIKSQEKNDSYRKDLSKRAIGIRI